MRTAVFSAKAYDREFLTLANHQGHDLLFFDARLDHDSIELARGCSAACIFVNDCADGQIIEALAKMGIHALVLRCSGYNHVDLATAARLGMKVVRVADYSPHAIAEHSIALLLMLDRKLHHAYNRIRAGNFSLDGLVGFDLHGKIFGIIGTGAIGCATAHIAVGFGCHVIACDPNPDPEHANDMERCGISYVSREELLHTSDIVSLHLPLTPGTKHIINSQAFALMKPNAILINTSRGGLLDTDAAINAIKSGHLGGIALDVYEGEGGLFFEDRSGSIILDDCFSRLISFPNVVVTGHQAFLTREALTQIAETTIANLDQIERFQPCTNQVPF